MTASLLFSNDDLLGETKESTAFSALATAYVHSRLGEFNVPVNVKETFIERVWAVSLLGRPNLAGRWLGFAVMAAKAIQTISDENVADPFAEFWTRHYSKIADDPDEDTYNRWVHEMVAAIDTLIARDSRRWKFGQ